MAEEKKEEARETAAPSVEAEEDLSPEGRASKGKKCSFLKKLKRVLAGKNMWLFVGAVALASALVAGAPSAKNVLGMTASSMAETEVKSRVEAYLDNSLPAEADYSVGDVGESDDGRLYKFEIKVGGQQFDSYATKDGKLLFAQAINLEEFLASLGESQEQQEGSNSQTGQVEKSARPDVKLFVMSYCPYGLQSEKGFLPAWKYLSEDIDADIYFVDYAMHGKKEIDENLRQYCIQTEESSKFVPYLECFTESKDAEGCLAEAGVDKNTISACESVTDKKFGVTAGYENKEEWMNGTYPPFNVHAKLNEEYGVKGSPTLIINGQQVSPQDRSPESYKKVICSAFMEQPAECGETLSTEVPTPGFGGGASESGGSGGGCGS